MVLDLAPRLYNHALTQLSMNFIMLIHVNVKLQKKRVGILKF